MADMDQQRLDDILGITRCARCGHRLDGHAECPFCAVVFQAPKKQPSGKWVYFTACLLTSPLSLYSIVTTKRLTLPEKAAAFSGCMIWFGLYSLVV